MNIVDGNVGKTKQGDVSFYTLRCSQRGNPPFGTDTGGHYKLLKRARLKKRPCYEISLYFNRRLSDITVDSLKLFHGWPMFSPCKCVR